MQPKLAILTAAVVALHCCTAAPNAFKGDTLIRPSPINPDIPMDPKPAETITFITDPKEIAKFKREINVEASTHYITAPTTIPPAHAHPLYQPEQTGDHNERLQHHRQTRDTKTPASPILSDANKPSTGTLNNKQTIQQTSTTVKPKPKRKRNRTSSTTSTPNGKSSTTPATATQIKHRQKRDDKDGVISSVPLIYRNQHKQPSLSNVQPPGSYESHVSSTVVPTILEHQSTVKPQTLPLLISDPQPSGHAHTDAKRDIPVPLVPKYHHPEESPKAEEKQDTAANVKDTPNSATNKPIEHAATTTTKTNHVSESSTEKKHEKRTVTESSDVVQVEDLSEYRQDPTKEHRHQPQHQNHEEAISSATGPSVFRHRPVPVAELFAKGKPTETPGHNHHDAN